MTKPKTAKPTGSRKPMGLIAEGQIEKVKTPRSTTVGTKSSKTASVQSIPGLLTADDVDRIVAAMQAPVQAKPAEDSVRRADAPKEAPSTIDYAIVDIMDAIGTLRNALGELNVRVDPILRPDVAVGEDCGKIQNLPMAASAYHERLKDIRRELGYATAWITAITQRVDL